MTWREIGQFAKDLIATLHIEVRRLKAEGVQIGVPGALLPRGIFHTR